MSTSLVIDVLDDEVVVERRGADGVVSGRAVVPVASTGYRVDPEVWWTALVDAVDAVVGPGALDASGIGEVVLCACPKGVVVTDGHGAPVGPALVGDDPDTAPDAKWLTKQVDGGIRYRLTPHVTLLAGVFEVSKPYFDRDSANLFTSVGDVRHRASL
mgnify:CR=1 FL=1